MITSKNITKLASVVFLIIGLVSLYKVSQPMIAEPDAYDRINLAIKNYDLRLLFDERVETWLPFHSTLLIITALPFNDFLYSPRIATLLLSLLSAYFIFLISKYYANLNEEKSIFISFFSFVLVLIYPLRFFLSDHTLSEHPFIFFFLAAYFLLIKNRPNLLLAAFIFNFAHALRYESWLFLPWFIGFVLITKVQIKEKILAVIIFSIFPSYWIWQSFVQTGNPFHFFLVKQGLANLTIAAQKHNLWLSIKDWMIRLSETFSWIGILITIFATFNNFSKKSQVKTILIWSFPIFLFFSLIYQSYSGSMEWLPHRYLLFPTILFIPMLVIGIINIKEKITTPVLIIFFLILAFSFNKITVLAKNYSQSNMFFLKESFFDLQNQIEKNSLDRQSAIYIHNPEYNERLWLEGPFYYFNQSTKTDRVSFNETEKIFQLINNGNTSFVFEKGLENFENFEELNIVYENEKFILTKTK